MVDIPDDNRKKIRESLVDGIFYPSEKDQLKSLILKLLDAEKKYLDESFAIISPHACLEYAGNIMAAAFQASAKRKIKTVVIIAPEHREKRNEIILPESNFFKTPLGLVPINQELVEELISCSNFIVKNDVPHLEEHCIETQLPFIQIIFPNADIVPIIMSKSKPRNIKLLANALQLTFSKKYNEILFVISVNIAHSKKAKETVNKQAEYFLKLLKECNWKGIQESISRKEISACGADCIAAILSFTNMNFKIDELKHSNSKELDPSSLRTVHYAAVSIKKTT